MTPPHRTRPAAPRPFLLLTLLLAPAASAEPLPLARDGKAALPIVLSEMASADTKAVAGELARYLHRISGADFTIETGDGSAGIVLGTLQQFPDPALSEPLAIRDRFDGREAYAVRTEPRRLRLIGATDLGASHAAFRLLEQLGCRWFFPAPEWEVVPSPRDPAADLTVDLNETSRPAIPARRIWYGWGFFPGDADHPGPAADYRAWARRNRMAQSFTINCGHAWQSVIERHKAEFDAHPEYLALVKGKRQGEQLCVSNPAVRQLAVADALDYLARHPESDMVSMECSDGDGQCECDDCRKLGSVSDRVFGLANEAARAVAEKFPGKMVGLYAYNEHCEPPALALEPNVYVQLTHGFNRGRWTFDELADLWPTRCRNMGFYDYFSVYAWDHDLLPGGLGADVEGIRRHVLQYAARHATSVDCESGDNWGPHGRGYYVANRLLWNPDADAGAILADFYDKAFGPGAAAMKRYYERLEPGNEPLMGDALLADAFRDVAEAAAAAKDRPDVQARLDDLKHYLRFVQLNVRREREKDAGRRKALSVSILTLAYRTRFSYVNHWEALRQNFVEQVAKEFDEPAWRESDKSHKPWEVAGPYTREETEREFREGLEQFQPDPVRQMTWSADRVPVKFDRPAGARDEPSRQQYQGAGRYALYSRTGEPLEVEITSGIIAWYRDRPEARYTFTDASGAKVAEGRLPLDGAAHPLSVAVPKPGLYFLDVNDFGTAWGIRAAAGRPCAVLLPRGRAMAHLGHMQTMYFYVPKGTKQIRYYWRGGPHEVRGPDGKEELKVTESGTYVSVPVPEGEDGKCWSFTHLALGHLWFFNVPDALAGSPDALLVPKDLAEKDGLKSPDSP